MIDKLEIKLLACFFVNMLCLETGNPFLPLYLKSLNGLEQQHLAVLSAMIISAPMLGLVLFSPLWGGLADKYGAKRMLLRASVGLCICQLLTGMASSVEGLLIARFLQGVFAGFLAATQIYALAVFKEHRKTLVLSRIQSIKAMATALGGISGGLLLYFIPYQGLYYFSAIGTLASTVFIYFALPHDEVKPKAKSTIDKPTRHTFNIMIVLGLIVLAQLAKFLPTSIFAYYADVMSKQHHALTGLLFAAPAFTIIIGAEINARLFEKIRLRARFSDSLTPCFLYFASYGLFAALVLAIQSQTESLTLIFICRLLWGLSLSALLPALITMLSELTNNRGYYIGLAGSVAKVGGFSGIYIGAFASSGMALSTVFLLMACIYGLFSILNFMFSYLTMKSHSPQVLK